MTHRIAVRALAPAIVALLAAATPIPAQELIVHVKLDYRAPVDGQPKPNFSPKGTQVALAPAGAAVTMPPGAMSPAKTGMIKVGPDQRSWIPVMATSCSGHPSDLCQLYIDRNRNGNYGDDGVALTGVPTQNVKTKAWWTSINKGELSVPSGSSAQPYLVDFWIVREDSAGAPDVLRYSVRSWRFGTATVKGAKALVAAMDSDNNAIWDKEDSWSVFGAEELKADQAVLTSREVRGTSRLMFLAGAPKEIVLEFRGFSPDGSSIDFAVVDKPVNKKEDRAADDKQAVEYPRPRTTKPVVWGHGMKDFNAALTKAKATGKKIFLDFEATWCGPCHTMDQWIWNDAEVAAELNAGFIGVKIDVDIEKALVKRFGTTGYPTMIILDAAGKEIQRVVEYQTSKEMLAFLAGKP